MVSWSSVNHNKCQFFSVVSCNTSSRPESQMLEALSLIGFLIGLFSHGCLSPKGLSNSIVGLVNHPTTTTTNTSSRSEYSGLPLGQSLKRKSSNEIGLLALLTPQTIYKAATL